MPITGETAFDALAARLLTEPDTDEGIAFRSRGLRSGGKIFAMLVDGELVVKLPADRCAALVSGGGARPFESGRRTMREWVTIAPALTAVWPAIADEALAFARRARGEEPGRA
jgi:hypothetical protein